MLINLEQYIGVCLSGAVMQPSNNLIGHNSWGVLGKNVIINFQMNE